MMTMMHPFAVAAVATVAVTATDVAGQTATTSGRSWSVGVGTSWLALNGERRLVRGDRKVALQHVVDVMSDCHRLKLRKLDIRVKMGAELPAGKGDDPLDIGREK